MGKSRNKKEMSAMQLNTRASTAWSEDNAKFGQRMLEKMGWKKGQGLGSHSQGVTENINLRLKLDSKGLGYKVSDQDQWLQVEHNFSTVLSRLNEDKDIVVADSGPLTTKSLESKSIESKNRVHYRKFTRGKDVSRYNEKDLMGILGQKIKHLTEENVKLKCDASYVRNERNVPDEFQDIKMSSSEEERNTTKTTKKGNESAKQKSISLATVVVENLVDRPYNKSCTKKKKRKKVVEDENQIDSSVEFDIETASLVSIPSPLRKKRKQKASMRREDPNSEDSSPDTCTNRNMAVQKENSENENDIGSDDVQSSGPKPTETPCLATESSTMVVENLVDRPCNKSYITKKKRKKVAEDENQINSSIDDIETASIASIPLSSRKKRKQKSGESMKREVPNSEDYSPDTCTDGNMIDVSFSACAVQKENSKNEDDIGKGSVQSGCPEPTGTKESTFVCRKQTKVERIAEKTRLLRKLLNEQVHLEFIGSNLENISGYGIS